MITGQEIFNIVDLFTSQSTINFYENIFDNLDLSFIPEFIESKRGPKGYSRHALTRAFVVMNCEHFREITLLCDFLNTNLKSSIFYYFILLIFLIIDIVTVKKRFYYILYINYYGG